MSRIGRKPVPLPKGVTAQIDGHRITVKGPKGEISRSLHAEMALALEDNAVTVRRPSDETRHKALHGLTRTLVANMVEGVTDGFLRILEIVGVGYKAESKGGALHLALGYSHPVVFPLPQGVTAVVESNTVIKLSGFDKELLGETAARVRMLRKPDVYKNKGIRYRGERLIKKVGKAAGK